MAFLSYTYGLNGFQLSSDTMYAANLFNLDYYTTLSQPNKTLMEADLAAALNIGELYTAEQFEGLVRMDDEGAKHKLLGLFVNLADYTVGSTKGGEITRFDQFDIDFNQQKYLIETRLSGALTRVYSAIALEEPVTASSGAGTP